tara:strand:- start:36687 stop:37304 length:618 start_codon:yes stop_codon:yes gene_type:complete
MSQKIDGISSIFNSAKIYDLFQKIISKNCHKYIANKYLLDCYSILDIGCGTGLIVDYLPDNIKYFGYDLDKNYIDFAKKKYVMKDNISFKNMKFEKSNFKDLDKFDVILAYGLLHHLSNADIDDFFKLASNSLSKKGKVVTIDVCHQKSQNFIKKIFISQDRGKNIKFPDEYKFFASKYFKKINIKVYNNLIYMPSDHCVLVAFK